MLLGLAPLIWFPGPWSWAAAAIALLLWSVRWRLFGRAAFWAPYGWPTLLLLALLPLSALPVLDWALALPKILGVLLGIAVMHSVANAGLALRSLLHLATAAFLVFAGGIGILALAGTEWPATKLVPFQVAYAHLPQYISGVVPHTVRGALGPNEVAGALTLFLPLGLVMSLAFASGVLPSGEAPSAGLTPGAKPATGLGSRAVTLAVCGVTVVSAVVILLTQSRSAYLGASVGVLVLLGWFAAQPAPSSVRILRWVALGLAVLAFGSLTQWLLVSWVNAPGGVLGSLPGRLELWDRAWWMVRDFPLTGIGPGQFSMVLQALYAPVLNPPDTFVPHAHNFLLQLALDLGLPGALAFLFILGRFFHRTILTTRRSQDVQARLLAPGIVAGMIAYLVYGLTDTIAIGARGGLGLWVILGLGAAASRSVGLTAGPSKMRFHLRATLLALGLAIVLGWPQLAVAFHRNIGNIELVRYFTLPFGSDDARSALSRALEHMAQAGPYPLFSEELLASQPVTTDAAEEPLLNFEADLISSRYAALAGRTASGPGLQRVGDGPYTLNAVDAALQGWRLAQEVRLADIPDNRGVLMSVDGAGFSAPLYLVRDGCYSLELEAQNGRPPPILLAVRLGPANAVLEFSRGDNSIESRGTKFRAPRGYRMLSVTFVNDLYDASAGADRNAWASRVSLARQQHDLC